MPFGAHRECTSKVWTYKYLVIDGLVLNLNPYIQANPSPIPNDIVDAAIREAISNNIVDATRLFLRQPLLKSSIPCIQNKYKAGHLSKATTGCFGVKLFFITSMIVILGLVLSRFLMAVVFDWLISFKLARPPPKSKTLPIVVSRSSPWALHQNSSTSSFGVSSISLPEVNVNLNSSELFTILLVTCYSEGESSIRCTIESLASTEYGDDHKLLFIVADGIITGSGNDRSTPDICVDLLEIDPAFENPEPMSYIAVAAGAKQHNMAKVYAGHFNHKGHRVPTIVVVKCGTPEEQSAPKPGNRAELPITIA
ncbi:hypothetical protein K7432_018288 [Basidiobolus ranarum]|uniref:Chitin synthase 4-like domain-containing protein n=1 Tax=Basidiobolus ranarum TaxID=34480 RepID=A0ABR2VJ94_9FUNG